MRNNNFIKRQFIHPLPAFRSFETIEIMNFQLNQTLFDKSIENIIVACYYPHSMQQCEEKNARNFNSRRIIYNI